MAVRRIRPVSFPTRKLSHYEQGKSYDMRGIKVDSCEKPSRTQPRTEHYSAKSEPGIKAGDVIWPNGTPGRELVIRDYYAEGVMDEEENEFEENENDLISEDEYRQYFDSMSDEEIEDEDATEALEEIDEFWNEKLEEAPMAAAEPVSQATQVALESERAERKANERAERMALELDRIQSELERDFDRLGLGDWASGCDTLSAARKGGRSYGKNHTGSSRPRGGSRMNNLKIHRLRNEDGKIVAEFSEVQMRRARKSMASRKAKWLDEIERNIVELEDSWDTRNEFVPSIKTVIVKNDVMDDDSYIRQPRHTSSSFNPFEDEPEPSDIELEREEERHGLMNLVSNALLDATSWNGRIDIRAYRKATAKLLDTLMFLEDSEAREIIERELRWALIDERPVEQHAEIDAFVDNDETGGRKPWWYGRKTAREIDCIGYKRSNRSQYSYNNKPVRSVAVMKTVWQEDGTRIRVPVDEVKETELRRRRRQILAEQTLLVA